MFNAQLNQRIKMMNNTQQELIQNEQQFVKGRVKSVFFQSNDSFYKVILISVEGNELRLERAHDHGDG